VNAPDGRSGEGRYHAWEKPLELVERFIKQATEPDGIVLDPFARRPSSVGTYERRTGAAGKPQREAAPGSP